MLLSAEGQPPAGSPAQDPAETGRIRGRVVDDGTGAPIADAQVSLSAGGGIRLSALTDADGRYEFSTLVPAGYSASARQSGYVGGFSGTFSTAVAGRSASVAAGQTLDNVDFRLARAAIVNGVVTDVDRAPAAGIDIHVLHHVYLKGRWRFVSIARTTTGTNGEYWIEDLRPGRYYLLARPRQAMSMLNQTVQGYAPTYYPGAHLPASAERIAVYEGPVNTFDGGRAVVDAGGIARRHTWRSRWCRSVRYPGAWSARTGRRRRCRGAYCRSSAWTM